MTVRLLTAMALAMSLTAWGDHAYAQQQMIRKPPEKPVSAAGMNRISHTCADVQRGDVVATANGGWVEYPTGTLMRTEVHGGGTGSPAAYCYYGVNYSSGMAQVYSVHFELKGFNANQCSVSGKSVNCSR